MDNQFKQALQAEGMAAAARYLENIFNELVEIKKLLQKKGGKAEEPVKTEKTEK